MNFCKKIMMLFLVTMILFAFSACGENAISPNETASPEETITKVLANLEQVKSMKSILTTETSMTTDGSESGVSTQTEVTAVYDPLNMKIESGSSLSSSNKIVTYVEQKDDMATTYMEYAGQWMKQSIEPNIILDSLRMYDTKQNAILFLQNAQDWQKTNTDSNYIVLQAVLPADTLAKVVEDTKSLQMMGMAGLTEDYYKGVTDTTITVTIDQQTLLPVNYTLDLANTLETLMHNVVSTFNTSEENQALQTKVNEYTLLVECSGINETKKVEIPKEVIDNAIDFEKQIENASISEIPEGENGEELAVE